MSDNELLLIADIKVWAEHSGSIENALFIECSPPGICVNALIEKIREGIIEHCLEENCPVPLFDALFVESELINYSFLRYTGNDIEGTMSRIMQGTEHPFCYLGQLYIWVGGELLENSSSA